MELDRLENLIGREATLQEVARELCFYAQALRPAVVGALQLTCSDESELECVQAFRRGFVDHLLPSLKFAHQSPFRMANPGARYEWGCLPIAEEHFACAARDASSFQLIVAKLNSHVCVDESDGEATFGHRERYGSGCSAYCGALHALLAGSELPFAGDLRESFAFEGLDRLELLEREVDPELRSLLAAVVSARLQARFAILDVQNHAPKIPTLWLVVPAVTLNRAGPDTEILCGLYAADDRTSDRQVHYRGLGDDPRRYEVACHHGRLRICDAGSATRRAARDHRRLVLDTWEARRETLGRDERIEGALKDARAHFARGDQVMVRRALGGVLSLLIDACPVSAAVLLFAHGIAEIHHAQRVHRLVRGLAGHGEARGLLEETARQIEDLPAAQAQAMLQVLSELYG